MFINYIVHVLIIVCIYLILTSSLQLTIWVAWLMNFWHIAFFALWSYTYAILSKMWLPYEIVFLLSWISWFIGWFIVSLLTKKLKWDYLALITLWFSFLVYALIINLKSLTWWSLGIAGIKKPVIFWFEMTNNIQFLVFSLIVLILSVLLIYKIIKSDYWRAIQWMRDNELSMNILWKNTYKMKNFVFTVSWFLAWIAWALFASYSTYVDPSSFTISQFIILLSIVIIGGLWSLKGTVLVGIILIVIPEILRFIWLPVSLIWPLRQIIYSVVLILIILIKPYWLFWKVKI